MSKRVVVRKHEYYDSVRLMKISEAVRREPGVSEAILMMATDNNKKLLSAAGLLIDRAASAAADDLVVAIVAGTEKAAELALEKATQLLVQRAAAASDYLHRTLESALAGDAAINLAFISVPGQHAAAEARRALENDLHVMVFSDNVTIEEEVELKRLARDKGLLLMGPDCGTAIIAGKGLGFANNTAPGPVGIVGASGTGIQEICVQLDRNGVGISHAIGTGGRDLKQAVGGITMLMGIDLLEADPATRVIILTSKPPSADVAGHILQRAARCAKPVVVNFLGGDPAPAVEAGILTATTLEQAARLAIEVLDLRATGAAGFSDAELAAAACGQAERFAPSQRFVRGLFSGGTLCYESLLSLQESIGGVYSNIALDAE